MLRLNDATLMLNTQYEDEDHDRPSEAPAERTKWHGDTVIYFGCPDVDAAYEHLREQGLKVRRAVYHRLWF